MKLISKIKDRRGVSAVVVAIVIAVLMGFVALAVDIGYVAATKNELQNAADAAALAGAGKLGQIYRTISPAQQLTYDCSTASSPNNCSDIKTQAKDVVGGIAGDPLKNRAAGKVDMVINDADISIFDRADPAVAGNIKYGDGGEPDITVHPDAVRVRVHRENGANGPITTFFARIFGINTVNLIADATAALTGPAVMDEGTMNLPIGLSWNQFFNNCDPNSPKSGVCSDLIELNPTKDSCAGWHNFFDSKDANSMADKAISLIIGDPYTDPTNPDYVFCQTHACGMSWLTTYWPGINNPPAGGVTPSTSGGDEYLFNGGDVSKLFLGSYLVWDPNDNKIPVMDPANPQNQLVDGSPIDKPAPFFALFDYFRFRDGDGDDSIWTATAPVYQDDTCPTCSNPANNMTIVGFARVTVMMPNPPPAKTITAQVDCNFTVIDGRGGGGNYGNLKGTIPNLIE